MISPNELIKPLELPWTGDPRLFSTFVPIFAGDEGDLYIDCVASGTFDPDGPGPLGVPIPVFGQVGVVVKVSRTESPTLQISVTGGHDVALTWSTTHQGFQLQVSEDCGKTWDAINDPPVTLDGVYQVTLPTAASRHRIYRLKK